MTAPEILYKITWKWPGGSPSGFALAPYASARQIESALIAAGYGQGDITVRPGEAPTGRHSAPEPPVDEPLTGAAAKRVGDRLRTLTGHAATDTQTDDDLDPADRAAMGRLGAKAFPHHKGE